MIANLIMSLFSIASNYVGIIFMIKVFNPHGCASQFKSSKPWYFVSWYPNMIGGYKMMWFFFGLGHNKGPHDNAGTVVK
jgi:hypothetical protein